MDLEGWSSTGCFADANPRAPAGAAGARNSDRGRIVRDHPARAAAGVHPPGQAQGRWLVRDRRAGVSAYYRFDDAASIRRSVRCGLDQRRQRRSLLRQDAERVRRAGDAPPTRTGDSVAGDMERPLLARPHLEALARTRMPLLEPGDVLRHASGDGVLAELLAPHAGRWCLRRCQPAWWSPPANACAVPQRGGARGRHARLPFAAASFDLVVLMHALTYADKPAQAVAEAARVLLPGGRLLLSSLARHEHRSGGGLWPRQPRFQRATAQVRREGLALRWATCELSPANAARRISK